MTLLYPIVKQSTPYNALRFSLRSLKCVGNPKVVVIGHCPDFIDREQVTYIPAEDSNKNPYINVIEKITKAFQVLKTDELVLMNDDFIFLRPYDLGQANPCRRRIHLYKRQLDSVGSLWSDSFRNVLKAYPNGVDYDMHYPFRIERKMWISLWKNYKVKDNYQYKSLYGNFCEIPLNPQNDTKVAVDFQFSFQSWRQPIISTHNTQEDTQDFRSYFSKVFPHKSFYETT